MSLSAKGGPGGLCNGQSPPFDGKANLWHATMLSENGPLVALCDKLAVHPVDSFGAVGAPVNIDPFGIQSANSLDGHAVPPPGDALHVATEHGVATFCLDAKTCPRGDALALAPPGADGASAPEHIAPGGCVTMSAAPDGSRLFCSVQSAGIAVYSLADRFAPRLLGHITQPGVDVRVYAPTVPIEVAGDLFLVAPVTTSQLTVFNVTAAAPAAATVVATAEVAAPKSEGFLGFGVDVLPNATGFYLSLIHI